MVEHGPFPLFQARGAKKIQGYSQVVYRPAGRDKRTARGQNQVESRKPLTYLIIWGGSRTSIPKEMFSAICDHRGCESSKAHDKDNLSDDHSDAVTVAISELRTHCDKEERKNAVDRRAYHSQIV